MTVGTLAVVTLTGAGEHASPRILDAVATKIDAWQGRRDADCRRKAMEIAVARADSMVMDYAREQKLMLERPSRPLKPEAPELRRPSDTLELRPFLGDSVFGE